MDGIAGLELLTVDWVGREEESGDERALPPEILPAPPFQPEVSGGLAYTVQLTLFGCCQKVVSDTFQGVACTVHLTYFLITLRNICQV